MKALLGRKQCEKRKMLAIRVGGQSEGWLRGQSVKFPFRRRELHRQCLISSVLVW